MSNIHQLLMIGIRGAELTRSEKRLLARYSPGGIILFSRNIDSAEQVADLTAEISSLCKNPPFISIDQEGGLVSRLRSIIGISPTPTNMVLFNNPELIEKYGLLTGQALASLGINLNFAPMVDIEFNDSNNALRERYWGSSPDEVIENASLFLKGMNKSGVLGCLKHFPGLGRTNVDSHFELPINNATKEDLYSYDLKPYIALQSEVPFVMISHCYYPQLFRDKIPSSIHPEVYRMLRDEINFKGITITDDLGMGAIAKEYSTEQIIEKAIVAGADILPFCNDFDAIENSFNTLEKLHRLEIIGKEAIDETVERILLVKGKLSEFSRSTKLKAQLSDIRSEVENIYNQTI